MSATVTFADVMAKIRSRHWTEVAQALAAPDSTLSRDEVSFAYGACYALQRRFEAAVQQFAQIPRASPLHPRSAALRARCLLHLGEQHLAIEIASQIRPRLLDNYKFLYRAGQACLRGRNFRAATIFLQSAYNLRPTAKAPALHLINALIALRRWRNALPILQSIKTRHPDDLYLHLRLIEALTKLQFFSEAAQEVTSYTAKRPDDLELLIRRAELHFRQREFGPASKLLRQLHPLLPHRVEIPAWLGFIQFAHGDFDGMLSSFDQASNVGTIEDCDALLPKEVLRILTRLGLWHSQNGRWAEAERSWRTLASGGVVYLDRLANIAQAKYMLSECLWHLNRKTEAANEASAAYDISPERARPVHYEIIGRHLFEQGHHQEARSIFEAGIRIHPHNAILWQCVAELELTLGRTLEAERAWLEAFRFDRSLERGALRSSIADALGRPIRLEDIGALPSIPVSFQVPVDLRLTITGSELIVGLSNCLNTVRALMLRQILTRFGKTTLGYIWALLQPLALFTILLIAFYALGRRVPPGITIEMFLLAGIVPFYLFQSVRTRVTASLNANRPLFYFRRVNPFVSYVSAGTLEMLTYIVAFYILLGSFYYFHQSVFVEDHLLVLSCLFILALFGFSLGIITAVLAQRFPFVEALIAYLQRGLLLTSGVFFYANELPPALRDILLYNPLFHVLEFLRGGLFVAYEARYAKADYVALWLVCLFMAGLVSDRLGRRYVRG
jgi:capsular polysaccharide transport system permease protein